MFNEINARNMEQMNVVRGLLVNKIFVAVIVFSVFLQAMIVEFAGVFAQTVPLNWKMWLGCIGIGATTMPIAAVAKLISVPEEPNLLVRGIASPRYHSYADPSMRMGRSF